MTITAEQAAGSRRLYDLADDVREERNKWADHRIRRELHEIAQQLDAAARAALDSSDIYADAWAEAGVLTLRKYIGQRKLIEHVT